MPGKIFKHYRYDIALNDGVGEHLITWMTTLMIFFVTLALALNFGLSSFSKNWTQALAGTITVEIRPPLAETKGQDGLRVDEKAFAAQTEQALTLLNNHEKVLSARLLPQEEIHKLISPWLGNAPADLVPLPALIDVRLVPQDNPESLQNSLQKELKKISANIRLDNHTDTGKAVRSIARTITLFSLLLALAVTALAVVAINAAVRSKLAIHQTEVEILHQIGASDAYIARQFRRHTLGGTLKGAIAGTLLAVFCLALIGLASGALSAFMAQTPLAWKGWAVILIAPVFCGVIIAHVAAQSALLRELARLP